MAIEKSKSIVVEILEEEHRALNEIVSRIRNTVDGIKLLDFEQPARGEVLSLFDYFYHRLKFHFHTEEELGLLKDIAKDKPRYRGNVDNLFIDHKSLLEQLNNIIELYFKNKPCASSKELDEFVNSVNEFFLSFKEHESRETSFVLDAENTDLGSHD